MYAIFSNIISFL